MSRIKTLMVLGVVVLLTVMALFPSTGSISPLSAGSPDANASPITSPAILIADGTDPVPEPLPIPWFGVSA